MDEYRTELEGDVVGSGYGYISGGNWFSDIGHGISHAAHAAGKEISHLAHEAGEEHDKSVDWVNKNVRDPVDKFWKSTLSRHIFGADQYQGLDPSRDDYDPTLGKYCKGVEKDHADKFEAFKNKNDDAFDKMKKHIDDTKDRMAEMRMHHEAQFAVQAQQASEGDSGGEGYNPYSGSQSHGGEGGQEGGGYEEEYGYIAGGNFPENPMGPHSWDPNAAKPSGSPGAIPEHKPEPELTPEQKKAKEAADAREDKAKMICGQSWNPFSGNQGAFRPGALSCKGMDECDKKFKDRHDKNVHNYTAFAKARVQQMVHDMHDDLNKNLAEHHAASAVALATQAAAGPSGDPGLSPYS